jgi:hypothetical protein
MLLHAAQVLSLISLLLHLFYSHHCRCHLIRHEKCPHLVTSRLPLLSSQKGKKGKTGKPIIQPCFALLSSIVYTQ